MLNGGSINAQSIPIRNIDADNINSGTINTNLLESKVITTDNFSAQSINANNITTGTLTAADINLGNGKFKVSTGGALTSTSGKIAGWSIGSSALSGSSGGYGVELTPAYLSAKAPGDTWEEVRWYTLVDKISDKRAKNNIESISNKYDLLFDNLKPVTFKYNDEYEPRNIGNIHIGFIAQDFKEAEEKANLENLAALYGKKLLKLDKEEIIALNTWQIQKLKKEQQEMKKEIEELKNIIKEIKESE